MSAGGGTQREAASRSLELVVETEPREGDHGLIVRLSSASQPQVSAVTPAVSLSSSRFSKLHYLTVGYNGPSDVLWH